MKMNKKALLGMFVAIVISLGAMGGYKTKKTERNILQVGAACAGAASCTEGGVQAGLAYSASFCATVSGGMAAAGVYGSAASTTNPVGWGYWAATAAIAL